MADISALRADLENGVNEVIASGDFQSFLEFMRGFHQYSPNNCMLIMSQCPHATRVAGYRSWLQKGRYVRKGEKAIKIIVPMIKKTKDDAGEDVTIPRFGAGNVFDISQTEGEDIPDFDVPVLTEDGPHTQATFAELVLLADRYGLSIAPEVDDPREGWMGSYDSSTHTISLRRGIAGTLQGVKTMAHELAHRKTENLKSLPREAREGVAEGAAYMVLRAMGLDSGQRSFAYIASWVEDKDSFSTMMDGIIAVYRSMTDDLEEMGVLHAEATEEVVAS